MNLPISIIPGKQMDGVAQPPPSFHVECIKRWNEDARFVAEGNFSTKIRLVWDEGTQTWKEVGQFMIVNVVIFGRDPDDTEDRWTGGLDAITQFSTLTHADIMKLANMQLVPFGYPYGMSDAELLAVKDVKLPDGYTLHQKMNWLVNAQGDEGKPNSVMWANGFWYEATWIKYGAMVNGGQLIAVSDQVYNLKIQLQNMSSRQDVPCRKIVPFRRADFGKPHATHPWLLQYATVANKGDAYGDFIRGHVMCPVALGDDFDFAGSFRVSAYYLPAYWTVPV